MSVKLCNLALNVGESLQINLGNSERTIIVGIDKHGNAFITGPLNDKLATLIVTEEGLTQPGGQS
ncbi:MAG: hypothetical protein ACKVRP_02430 [Bacteroidota bacterium]